MCCRYSRYVVVMTDWRFIWDVEVTMMRWRCIWYADIKWLTDAVFSSLALQSITGIAFGSLTLERCTDVLIQIDASYYSKAKENIYINKHSGSLKELAVFALLDSSTPNTHLLTQVFVEILKKKESFKLHCQTEAMCKFDCYRPTNALYIDIDLDIVHHPDSLILIFHRCY